MEHETAGDPVRDLKWTRRTTAKVADELRALGIDVCPQTVARLLKAMGYSLRVNHKKRAGASHPRRDEQFRHITELRERCAADNVPVISVDTKKKELVGTFRNPGAKWDHSPELVNDHDFRSDAEGLAIPYGIYDPRANAGTVFVGQTADTPAFAVDCIEKWWRTEGCKHYPDADALQILADDGGSNSCTARAWKFNLQHRLANRHGLRVSVAHYPPATSKWNPIEHRLGGCAVPGLDGDDGVHQVGVDAVPLGGHVDDVGDGQRAGLGRSREEAGGDGDEQQDHGAACRRRRWMGSWTRTSASPALGGDHDVGHVVVADAARSTIATWAGLMKKTSLSAVVALERCPSSAAGAKVAPRGRADPCRAGPAGRTDSAPCALAGSVKPPPGVRLSPRKRN